MAQNDGAQELLTGEPDPVLIWRIMFARWCGLRALAITAVAGGCAASSADLTMQITRANERNMDVTIHNNGDASTALLSLSLDTGGVFAIASDDCSGRALGSRESCVVGLSFPVSADDQREGTLTADDGHGVRATMTLTATKAFVQVVVDSHLGGTQQVYEGGTADATLWIDNRGNATSGPITLDFPAKLVADQCSGAISFRLTVLARFRSSTRRRSGKPNPSGCPEP